MPDAHLALLCFNKIMPDFRGDTSTEFESITVTAINNAMVMAYSGVHPYPEISAIAQKLWAADGHATQPELVEPRINTPKLEVRYRLGTLLTCSATQVLDIASGLTPRGLSMTEANPGVTYVEFDLPRMIDLKERVIQRLVDTCIAPCKPANLHLEQGSAVDPDSVLYAARHFNQDKPVAIITEGLLHYLPHPEKTAVARSIGAILRDYGRGDSIWYTDMPIQRSDDPKSSTMASTTTKQTGRNIAANRFRDEQAVREFFARNDLEVKQLHSYIEPELIESLTSPALVGASREEVIAANRPWSMYAIGLPD